MFDTILDLLDRDRRHHRGDHRRGRGLGGLLERLTDHDRYDDRPRRRDDDDRGYARRFDRDDDWDDDDRYRHRRHRREFDFDDD